MKSDMSMNPPLLFRGSYHSPDPSCVSMKSDMSMNPPLLFRGSYHSPDPSCVSMKSDMSMNPPLLFRGSYHSPDPSCVSMKSDMSMNHPLLFRGSYHSPDSSCASVKSDRSMTPPLHFRGSYHSPDPSCVSMKSDMSMNHPLLFRGSYHSPDSSCASVKSDRSMTPPLHFRGSYHSPDPSCVSMKSDMSMNPPLLFRGSYHSPDSSCASVKSDMSMNPPLLFRGSYHSPDPSCVSMKSDMSMNPPLLFRGSYHSPDPSCVSMKSDMSMNPPLLFRGSYHSPDPSCVSMKSDMSMNHPLLFRGSYHSPDSSCASVKSDRSMTPPLHFRGSYHSPDPSCVSMKSDMSMNHPLLFRGSYHSPDSSCASVKSDRSMTPPLHFRGSYHSPDPSCVSMKSDMSMNPPLLFRGSYHSPDPSCVSMKSDMSMNHPLLFRGSYHSPDPSCVSMKSDIFQTEKSDVYSKTKLKSIFKGLERRLLSLLRKEVKKYVNVLSSDYPACSEREEEDEDGVGEGVMKITLKLLRNMKHTLLADTLQRKLVSVHQKHLRSTLTETYRRINEGLPQQGTSSLLNEIYTALYITEGGSGEVNTEHEVRQIETVSRRPAAQEKPIKCSQLFKDKAIRTVLTKGVAGIGKTVSVQKFILDWAEGKENQDVLFIFPLPFRELNLMKEKRLSLMELLHQFFPKIKELKSIDCDSSQVLFIFDGLDECRLPLDFQNNERLWDVTQSASVDVLLTNLIKGNLLPSALLWITSRPAAANQIPPRFVDQVTEVRGFSDPQKEEYFRKRISDQSLANQIISHIKSSRSLYIMCHIPVFCWISATVLEGVLGGAEGGETPKTLTQMFAHFLIFQIKHKEQKYQGKQEADLQKTRESVLALGKLAFQQLEKGNLIFYEDELRECGIDVREVSVYSGVCTQIFREEFGLHLGKVFSFVHLSVQEFLAALYTLLYFTSRDEPEQSSTDLSGIFRASTMSEFLKSAVDKALQSENGHLDLFLRFLLGLSLESNQTLLRGILTQTGTRSHSTEETVQYIKEKIRKNPSPETSINLFHCLNELGDQSLEQEVQEFLNRSSGSHDRLSLSPAQWSALVFVLLNSEEVLKEFDLSKYDSSEECLLNLLPVVKASRKAHF
ncbi:uncharacterized protein [Hoplias malabaricus]|uniref:uncharacterized protein isoform X2 n=1 Tax=Hoplias malabaricus TaxID=27720 RepID=UPI0034622C84